MPPSVQEVGGITPVGEARADQRLDGGGRCMLAGASDVRRRRSGRRTQHLVTLDGFLDSRSGLGRVVGVVLGDDLHLAPSTPPASFSLSKYTFMPWAMTPKAATAGLRTDEGQLDGPSSPASGRCLRRAVAGTWKAAAAGASGAGARWPGASVAGARRRRLRGGRRSRSFGARATVVVAATGRGDEGQSGDGHGDTPTPRWLSASPLLLDGVTRLPPIGDRTPRPPRVRPAARSSSVVGAG